MLRERKDHAVKQLWGLIENQTKAKGKQRSAFKKACDTIKERIEKRLNDLWKQLAAKAKAKKERSQKAKPKAQPTAAVQPKEDELSRKLKVLAESSDRLLEYSLSAEFLNPKSFNFFTGQNVNSTTYLEFTTPQVATQGDDSKQKESEQNNEAKDDKVAASIAGKDQNNAPKESVLPVTAHQDHEPIEENDAAQQDVQSTDGQAHQANGNESQGTAQPDEGAKGEDDSKQKPPPDLTITRAMGSDGKVHKLRAPIKFDPKGRGKLWYYFWVEPPKARQPIQQTSLLFQIVRYKNKRAYKRIVVSSCLRGRAPCKHPIFHIKP